MARYFGWDRTKWETVPWHDQKLYVQKLIDKGLLDLDDIEPGGPGLDDLAAAGFNVQRG